MKRIVLLIWVTISIVLLGHANDVRVEDNVVILPKDIDDNGVATVRLTVKWDNSWRDAFNYDGIYLFFKYKFNGDGEQWHHAYLMDDGHIIKTPGYDKQMHKTSGGQNLSEGMFIHRNKTEKGDASVDLELKWGIASNTDRPVRRDDFVNGQVFISVMLMEMVYIPRGAFRLGDTKSKWAFKNKNVTIPPDKDILSDTNKAYIYTSSCQVSDNTKGDNPPEFAVNRINDPGTTATNAWVGCLKSGAYSDWWEVEFDEAKTIHNIAIESTPTGTPNNWVLEGYGTSERWEPLYSGTGADWMINSSRTYPCTHAIEIENTQTPYKRIRINITNTTRAVVIKNVAMTTENIYNSVDNSIFIHNETYALGGLNGMYADDGETWTGSTGINYPNGFPAFWAMKYEISQEQYVSFLNKLTAEQQRARTISSALESLNGGEYVFGNDKDTPTARNGIKLVSKGVNDAPYVFANDLNYLDESYAQDGDGQTLACNFLNAGDMLAYADWCGLRPLTEMEFEKMARRPYPFSAIWNEYAWNTNVFEASPAVREDGKGSKTESPTGGNVNAKNLIGGPIRCGAYAKAGAGQSSSGSSFWGVMELSGNVAEIYYNANSGGRVFHGSDSAYHGNGKLAASGQSDMSVSYWPKTANAFAIRGGSFASEESELAISDRSRRITYTTDSEVLSKRDSTSGFRLGCTAPILLAYSDIILQNGKTIDTICSGESYTIKGALPSGIKGAYRIVWFKAENSSDAHPWDVIPGEENPSLEISNLVNINEERGFFKDYWFTRRIYTSESEYRESRAVRIRVVNDEVHFSSLCDSVYFCSYTNGITVTSNQPATFKWYWVRPNSGNRQLSVDNELIPNYSYQKIFKPEDFHDGSQSSNKVDNVLVETNVMNTCFHRDTIKVYNFLDKTQRFWVKNFGDYRAWEDGTYASSAAAYLLGRENEYHEYHECYEYRGDIGSGIYIIDPDGPDGPIEPYTAYCDMDTDGGGWTRFDNVNKEWYGYSGGGDRIYTRVTNHDRFVALANISNVQRLTGFSFQRSNCSNVRNYLYTSDNGCVSGIQCPLTSVGSIINISISKNWANAMYKTRLYILCGHPGGTSFSEMWFR